MAYRGQAEAQEFPRIAPIGQVAMASLLDAIGDRWGKAGHQAQTY
jgi:hypothetical protein